MTMAWAALAAVTLLRLAVAVLVPLSPDEAYYWVWSRALAPGYLDHPPMVALWLRAGTWLAGDTPLGVRLLGPLSAALGTVLLARAARAILPDIGPAGGITAAALLNATLVFAVGSVTLSPDTPLLLFWTATLWALGGVIRAGRPIWWLVAGLAAGAALDSKYTAILLPAGIALWLLATPAAQPWLRRPAPWIAAALAAAAVAPVAAWNAAHGWASFAKQAGRAADWQPARALRFVAELFGGQIGLATPLVFVLCAAGAGLAVRRAWRDRDAGWTLLACLIVPPILLFLQHALGDRVQANWPAIVYPAAIIAAAGLSGARWTGLRAPAIAVGAGLTLLAYMQAALAPLPLSARIDPTLLRLGGWEAMARSVEAARLAADAGYVAADGYGPAAELAWHMPAGVTVVGVEPRWSLFALPDARPVMAGRVGLLVRSARRGDDLDPRPWVAINEVGRISRSRDGLTAEEFRLYRVVGRDSDAAAAILPRPR